MGSEDGLRRWEKPWEKPWETMETRMEDIRRRTGKQGTIGENHGELWTSYGKHMENQRERPVQRTGGGASGRRTFQPPLALAG